MHRDSKFCMCIGTFQTLRDLTLTSTHYLVHGSGNSKTPYGLNQPKLLKYK